jgi:hypothetical protein
MSFADPQSVTFPAPISATVSLPRISVGVNQSEYQSQDGLDKLSVSHQYGKRTRRLLRLDHAKLSADVLDPSLYSTKSMACYLVFDVPPSNTGGFTVAEELAVYGALKGAMTASTDALISKLLGGES